MSTPSPDYNEPWTPAFRNSARTANGYDHGFRDNFQKRAIACVNACQGMADPATEIQAMRDAIKEAREALKAWPRAGSGMNTDFTSQSEAFRTGQHVLAKLQPFIK